MARQRVQYLDCQHIRKALDRVCRLSEALAVRPVMASTELNEMISRAQALQISIDNLAADLDELARNEPAKCLEEDFSYYYSHYGYGSD